MNRITSHSAVVLATVLCASCQSQNSSDTQSLALSPGNALQFTPVGAPVASSANSYRIGVSDVLSISVFQVAELSSNRAQVSGEGTINLPLAGVIRASGLTPRELEQQIRSRLIKYVQSPQVTVSVAQMKSSQYTVDGAINSPGVFPIRGAGSSLLSAVASAGGFKTIADKTSVVVYRTVGSTRQAARFDVEAIRSGSAPDPEVKSGDVIVVDASGVRSALDVVMPALPVVGFGEGVGQRAIR